MSGCYSMTWKIHRSGDDADMNTLLAGKSSQYTFTDTQMTFTYDHTEVAVR